MAYNNKIRMEDERKERLVHSFLEENFYKVYCSDYTQAKTKREQVLGIDSTANLYIDSEDHKIDEKSAVNWRNINTFTLELSFRNKNDDVQVGWFLNEELETTDYLFVWLDNKNYSHPTKDFNLTEEDISNGTVEIKFALVPKNKIIEELFSIGWTKENLLKKDKQIREVFSYEEKNSMKVVENKNCLLRLPRKRLSEKNNILEAFTFSTQLSEKPINIKLNRENLIDLSIIHN